MGALLRSSSVTTQPLHITEISRQLLGLHHTTNKKTTKLYYLTRNSHTHSMPRTKEYPQVDIPTVWMWNLPLCSHSSWTNSGMSACVVTYTWIAFNQGLAPGWCSIPLVLRHVFSGCQHVITPMFHSSATTCVTRRFSLCEGCGLWDHTNATWIWQLQLLLNPEKP